MISYLGLQWKNTRGWRRARRTTCRCAWPISQPASDPAREITDPSLYLRRVGPTGRSRDARPVPGGGGPVRYIGGGAPAGVEQPVAASLAEPTAALRRPDAVQISSAGAGHVRGLGRRSSARQEIAGSHQAETRRWWVKFHPEGYSLGGDFPIWHVFVNECQLPTYQRTEVLLWVMFFFLDTRVKFMSLLFIFR